MVAQRSRLATMVKPPADMREAERLIWAGFGRGALIDLRTGDPGIDDPARGEHWGDSRRVRAEVIATLLLGAVSPEAGCVPGVRLAGALIEGTLDIRQGDVACVTELTDCCFDGVILLAGARTRTIDLSGSMLQTLDAEAAEIGGHFLLDRCRARLARLDVTQVNGRLSLNGAHFANPSDDTLSAHGLIVNGGMYCKKPFHAEGEVRLLGAKITGELNLNGARLDNPGGKALSAARLAVNGSMLCSAGFRAEGEVRLARAHITGQLNFDGARLVNPGGSALSAEGLTVDFDMFCRKPFHAEGEIQLSGAHITGQLDLDGAQLANPPGKALFAEGLAVQGSMFCRDNFEAQGEVCLLGAHITDRLRFNGATLSNCEDGVALNCDMLHADSLFLNDTELTGTLDLRAAQLRTLLHHPSARPTKMLINGFVYRDLNPYADASGPEGRLAWLAHAVTEYRAQPYEQLAAYYRRQGHDEQARRVLLAKQRARRRERPWWMRWWGWLQDGLAGYGYAPGRALVLLLIAFVVGWMFFRAHPPNPVARNHPSFNAAIYVLDLLIPAPGLGQLATWNPQGVALALAAALRAFGWLLAITVIASISRALGRD